MEVAVEDDDPLEALGDQAVDDGTCPAAGPEDDREARHLLLADELVEGDAEARHVGVVADEPLAFLRDRVDGARDVGVLGQPIDERDHPLLVGDRDVRAEEVVAPQLVDRVGEADRRPVPELVRRVDALVVEGGLLHRARQRMGDRMADEDDALRHAPTLSSSAKKPGYEIAALPGRRTLVSPLATRPAIANVIASRWSSRLSVAAPSRPARPWIVRSSPSTSIRAPSARSPSAVPAIRSDSLWRSSPAPRMTVVPEACEAARQRIGISSMAAATSAGARSIARRSLERTVMSATGSPTPASPTPWRAARVDRPLLDVGAHRPKDVDDGPSRRVDADAAQRQLGVRVDGRGDEPERGRRNVARNPLAHRTHRNPSFETDRHRPPDPADALGHDRDAPRPQHPLRMVAGRDRLANRRPSLRSQPREQDRRLDLGARHGRRDVHRLQRGATDHGHRREGVVRSGVEHRTHRAQRFDDTSDRSATQ